MGQVNLMIDKKKILTNYLKTLKSKASWGRLEVSPITFGYYSFHNQRMVCEECACIVDAGMEEGLYYNTSLDVFFYDGQIKDPNLTYSRVSFLVEQYIAGPDNR